MINSIIPGSQSGNGGASSPQLRRAKIAVNQAVVEAAVDNQRRSGHRKADLDRLDASQRAEEHVRHSEKHVGKADDLKVFYPFGDDLPFVGEKPQRLMRQEKHHCPEDNGKDDAEL